MNFTKGVSANFGNMLEPSQVKNKPLVKWKPTPKKFYALCMAGNTLHLFSFNLKSYRIIL